MQNRWSKPTAALHWIGALLIIGLATVGFIMTDLPAESSSRRLLSQMHTIGGLTLMLLTVARLIMRRRGGPIEPLPIPVLHQRGIAATHTLLYIVTFGLGLSGFITGIRSTWPDYIQGKLAEAPALGAVASRQVHEVLVIALLVLVGLHVGGVMLQQLRRGGVVRRMMPFLK